METGLSHPGKPLESFIQGAGSKDLVFILEEKWKWGDQLEAVTALQVRDDGVWTQMAAVDERS